MSELTPNGNQTEFEIARDLIFLMRNRLETGETVTVTISKTESFYDWGSTKGAPYGTSEISRALREAYEKETAPGTLRRGFRG